MFDSEPPKKRIGLACIHSRRAFRLLNLAVASPLGNRRRKDKEIPHPRRVAFPSLLPFSRFTLAASKAVLG